MLARLAPFRRLGCLSRALQPESQLAVQGSGRLPGRRGFGKMNLGN
jgi:hypothetical protein